MPRNPRDDDPVWSALPAALLEGRDFHVVTNDGAVAVPGAPWTAERAARFVQAMRACELRWISARHGRPLAPHFAVAVEGDEARLVELVTMRFRGDGDTPAMRELVRDLGVVAVTISIARPDLRSLRVTLRADGELPDGFVVDSSGTTVDLRRM